MMPLHFSEKTKHTTCFAILYSLYVIVLALGAKYAEADDTYGVLGTCVDTEIVSGEFGYDDFSHTDSADGEYLALDARGATWTLANSQNDFPTAEQECNVGPRQTNKYPIKIYNDDKVWLVGGQINGQIVTDADWDYAYCNSAAVILKQSAGSAIDGMRITSSWDTFRAGPDSPDLVIKNNWVTDVSDDVVENDFFHPLTFEDNLVDGTFQGISVHSGGDINTQSPNKVYLYGNVIRIQEYLYKGGMRYGALFKNETESPLSHIHNTVVAVDYNGGGTFSSYWRRSWEKIESCSNNQFLWMSDEPIPAAVGTPPACFTVITGDAAIAEWERAKQNWINCHPDLPRRAADPASNPAQCKRGEYGGYSRIWFNKPCNTCHPG